MVSYSRLFILVEGDDDERFFKAVIVPQFEAHYDHVQVWQYAQKRAGRIASFLISIRRMEADYLFVGDFDGAPCVTKKKHEIVRRISGLSPERLAVVIDEIESWYYAGIDAEKARKMGVREVHSTESLTKEKLERLIEGRFDSRIDFMVEALKGFSISTAESKNGSFRYFVREFMP